MKKFLLIKIGFWVSISLILGLVILVATIINLVLYLFSGVQSACSTSNQTAIAMNISSSASIPSLYADFKQYQPQTTLQGAAGVLGNWEAESGFNPAAIQGGKAFDQSRAMDGNVSGYAFGLAQWDGGRRVNLLNYASSQGKQWSDLSLQLDYAFNGDGSDSQVMKQILTETDVTQAATDYSLKWERNAGGASQTRLNFANAVLSQLESSNANQSLNANTGNTSSTNDATTTTGDLSSSSICGSVTSGSSNSQSISALESLLGQYVPDTYGGAYHQCYDVSAYYAHSINSNITLFGGSGAAANIGSDYKWSSWGWIVINNPSLSQVKAGQIINFRESNKWPYPLTSDGHTGVIKSVDASKGTITMYNQNVNGGPEVLSTGAFNADNVTSVISPPGN